MSAKKGVCESNRERLWDAPVDTGMWPARNRGLLDRFESEQADFFECAREVYPQRARQFSDRYAIIAAALPWLDKQGQTRKAVDDLYARQ